ncbi:MAG: hypothetical protein V4699_00640 [Patescibacteria group bacterium]
MKKIIPVTIFLVLVLGVLYFINKKGVNIPKVAQPVTTDSPEIQLCFYGEHKTSRGLYDVAWLKMNLAGTKVTGEFRNLPAETDSKLGTFQGVVGPVDKMMMARTADVWWDSLAEGMRVTEQLKIVFGEGNAAAGFGEMVDRGDGVYVYKDASQLTHGLSMTDVACGDLDERLLVEKYIRENIKTIVSSQPALGGTWYATTIHLNTASRTGTVAYEDGHIDGKLTFSYTVQNGVVTIIKIL